MKKKKAILIGIIVLLCTLFINLVITDNNGGTDLTFSNIEALAQKEGGGTNPKPQCIESGFICTGLDKDGVPGHHNGLMVNPEL